ncbi:MAG TPA: hypothetical protein VIL97_02480 [Thermoanaerobaculia bacterium]
MRKAILGISVVLFATATPPAYPCGDKIVDMSRGVRFQRACAIRPASVLVYAANGPDAKSLETLKKSLVRVGHKVQLVRDAEGLKHLLPSKAYDLLIAPIDEATTAAALLKSTESSALLIPVLFGGKSAGLASVSRAYPFVLSVPGKAKDQILTIDEAMKSRLPADAAAKS